MHASNSRTTAPGWRPMARFSFPTEPRTCERHGDFLDLKMPAGWAGCPRCNGERIAREDAGKAAAATSAHRRQVADSLLGRAAIPARFADKRLDNFAPHAEGPRRALELARRYADGFGAEAAKSGASLVFCGGVGAGKTHLAVGIAHRLMEQGRIAVFTSVINAIRRVKDTYRRDSGQSEAQVVAGFIRPDLLILDEVGVQFGSETEKMILFEIINGRYEQLKPTIVISNLAKDALTDYLGERVVDRLREGGGRMLIFDWPSYRRQAA